MNSIRLSLIVYFLVLIAMALGGVSMLVYQTVSITLKDKQAKTQELLDTQFQAQCHQARLALDRKIHLQAQRLASKAITKTVKPDVFFLVSATGIGSGSNSRLMAPLLLAPLTDDFSRPVNDLPRFVGYLRFMRPVFELQIPAIAIDALMPLEDEHPPEFFQTYRSNGVPAQRSASLKDHWFTLNSEMRDNAEEFRDEYDDIDFDGRQLRRVTMKTRVSRILFPRNPSGPKGKGPLTIKGLPIGQPQAKSSSSGQNNTGVFFIQYAADASHVAEQTQQFQADHDSRIAQMHEQTRAALGELRHRLFWIAIVTFTGIVAGGYLLLRLGLAPLSRLTDAVSKVSEKNFQLQVNPDGLPSELRPIAERLSQSLEQLQKAFAHEKQAAADISHELRTPLAALLTTLDVALRKQRSAEEYREVLAECRSSGQHMSHLVERLMALARLDAGVERINLEAVDVSELAQQCADMVRPLADEQNLALHTHLAESVVTATDAGKLREIVLNLLHNAIEYNKPEGRIELTVERMNGWAQVEVRDTGIGIAPEAQDHLFERFFRADPSRHADTPHCGLGLAIVKSYVDLLGGTIQVQSSPAGSAFRIRLPLREADTPRLEPEAELQTA
jgi:heavy metal sensor kinase